MGPKVYKVLPDWFRRTDSLGHSFSSWCKKIDDKEILCIICKKNIFCASKGFSALTQHVLTNVHKENASDKLSSCQLLITSHSAGGIANNSEEPKSDKKTTTSLTLFNSKESVTRAEIIWTLKSVRCNMAPGTCDDLKDVFSVMFPGTVSESFCLGRTKLSYLISEALGPYFRQQLLEDVRGSYFSLLYDETTNNANKKELQFRIRFWSEQEKEVVCKHLQTVFLGHATAEDIILQIQTVLYDCALLTNKVLMLGSDGPNINKKVWRLFNNQVTEERGQGLLNVGTCILHIVHNTFLKGLEEYGDTAAEIIINLHYFFKKFPSRWEDFERAQEKKNVQHHRFLKHVSSRWLTAGPASERVLEQWPAIEEYFLRMVPIQEKKLMQTQKYQNIVKAMRYIDIKVELGFLIDSSELYSSFLESFQNSKPLIHILDRELSLLRKKISARICKPDADVVNNIINLEHLRKASEIDCGEKTTTYFKELSEKERLSVFPKIQRHFMASHNYLVEKYLETNNILTYFGCFHYENISNAKSLSHISELAKKLCFIGVTDLGVKDEWRILQTEVSNYKKADRIDHFWRGIIYQESDFGKLKFPSLNKLVKACLSVSHGNSDAERGFSVSGRILAEDKSAMSERVLNDRLTIRDALTKFENVAQVPITKDLLKMAYSARKSYEMYLEEQKKLKEEQKRLKEQQLKEEKERKDIVKQQTLQQEKMINLKGSVEKLEEKANILSQEKKETQESADALFKEANDRLKLAIKKKDLEAIRIAQGMMEGTLKLREKEREQENKEEKLNKIMNKRKANIIEAFTSKKFLKK